MAPVRLISLEKQFVEKIDWEKINWKDKGLINLPHVMGYYFGAKTDKMSIAKTYEDENTMIVTLQIPKSDYKNKSFQNLLKCPELPVQDEYYYRDWAVHMVMAGDNEKTVLFSHGRITLDIKDNAKADYVTVKVVVKQKEDMLRGVVFGLKLDETYKEAWEKVMNPVGLNVVVPVVAASSGVVLTGIKNAKEITDDEGQDLEESGKEFVESANAKLLINDKEIANAKVWIDGKETPAYLGYNAALKKDVVYLKSNSKIDLSLEQYAENNKHLISYWHDENGIINASYNTKMPNFAVQLIRNEENVKIIANLYFTGSYAGKDELGLKKTWAELAYNGIKRVWVSGRFLNHQDPNTKIVYDNFGQQGFVEVKFEINRLSDYEYNVQKKSAIVYQIEDAGRGFAPINLNWKVGSHGMIGALVTDVQIYTKSDKNANKFTAKRFGDIAAHEFGHVLGLGDAYEDVLQKEPYITDEIRENEIMRADYNKGSGIEVKANTIEMILEAFKLNILQIYDPTSWNQSKVIRLPPN